VGPGLSARVAAASADTEIPVIVTLRDQVDAADYAGRRPALLAALRRTAARTQPEVLAQVDGPVRRFWIVNGFALRATPAEIGVLAADPEVATVDLDRPVRVAEARTASVLQPFPDAGEGDWGLEASGVRRAWQRFGVTGRDVRVGSIDTGVDAGHPDLRGKVVAWRDFIGGAPQPYDDNGHGTHTIGTMVGGRAGGAPIGVAPGARVVVAKAIADNGVGPGSALLAAAEWMTDPDGDPATADQPVVVNNSWSADNPNDPWFRALIRRWLELGIVPVFAAGNSGPGPRTIGSPAGYPEALAVGAVDEDVRLAPFSSEGPVDWTDLDGTGPVAGTRFTKPDVVAPGVGITSSVGTGYLTFSGTSMASPHVAGVVALMTEANPAVRGQAAADVIRGTARDAGRAGPDSRFGHGRLDAEAAVARVSGAAAASAPQTRLVRTPGRMTRRPVVAYDVRVQGAGGYRYRVDGGAWRGPATGRLVLRLAEGRHRVEVQAWDAEAGPDATPARHVVTVDRTPPRLSFSVRHGGGRATLRADVRDDVSRVAPRSVRWRLDGATRRGASARVAVTGRARVSVALSAADRAGNVARIRRTLVLAP